MVQRLFTKKVSVRVGNFVSFVRFLPALLEPVVIVVVVVIIDLGVATTVVGFMLRSLSIGTISRIRS
jgi:K+-transporting ATPase A subunit